MAKHRSRYRLVGLDGQPHPVLDAPYDTLELALEPDANPMRCIVHVAHGLSQCLSDGGQEHCG